VPKKRGPKTDVLEALLKRVDGLEQQLKDKKRSGSSPAPDEVAPLSATTEDEASSATATEPQESTTEPKAKRQALESSRASDGAEETAVYSPPAAASEPSPGVQAEALLDTYFSRFHAKPYHILDESTVRQRLQLNQLPPYLVHAVYAVAARYVTEPALSQMPLTHLLF
jgi:hypothetical protein